MDAFLKSSANLAPSSWTGGHRLAVIMGFHPLDLLIVTAYLGVVMWLGWRGSRGAKSQEGFFLGGRKLGKRYQFFLNFGNSTDANGAVSTSSLVYQQGASGAWMGFQLIFLHPYYWFMYPWFRRVRLTTTADLFEDRLGSRRLASFYALFQCMAAVFVIIGFGNLVTYKISSAILVKPESAWSPVERASVEEFKEMRGLERTARVARLSATDQSRLTVLREKEARGDLNSYITAIKPIPLYVVYSLIVGGYVVLGGLAATAINEIFQSLLVLMLSVILLPLGFSAIGGVAELAKKIPQGAFEFLGSTAGGQHITALSVFALVLVTLVQIVGIIGNMGIAGSAKNEYAARFGAVAGNYAKRLVYIMWSFVGLIAIALYSGEDLLSDSDLVWGTMSRELLGPGLLGLMMIGVLAANMSTVAAQSVSVSALVVRNIWRPLRPTMSDAEALLVGRVTIVVALVLGVFAALQLDNVFTALTLVQTVSVPFGAVILLMFFWRRLTLKGAWLGLMCSITINIVGPLVLTHMDALKKNPTWVTRTEDSRGRPESVFFDKVIRTDPTDPTSPLIGHGRLHVELITLKMMGFPVEKFSSAQRFAARYIFDAISPFVFLIGFSLLTKQPSRERADQFFGRMKTPVGATPELEAAALSDTTRVPNRFDHLKLFGAKSSWEFCKWDRVDTIGFFACCAISSAVIVLFWGLLRWAASAG